LFPQSGASLFPASPEFGAVLPLKQQKLWPPRCASYTERSKTPPDQEFLLYPLDTGDDPLCDRCRLPMLLSAHEVRDGKPDFVTFRCDRCGRSEKFVCEDDAAD
jgi:hypothetical protein